MPLNYQSSNPANNFIMIENEALNLSPNAYYLYSILRNLHPDANNSTKILMQRTGLNKYAFQTAKNELIDKGWLVTKQLYGNRYAFYIGKEAIKKYKYSKNNKKKRSRYPID